MARTMSEALNRLASRFATIEGSNIQTGRLVRFYPPGSDTYSIHTVVGWAHDVGEDRLVYRLSGCSGPVDGSRVKPATEDDIRDHAERNLQPPANENP